MNGPSTDDGQQLTRRRAAAAHGESWEIWYDGVRVGSIGQRAGIPTHEPGWQWRCGFYLGSDPRDHRNDVAESLEAARAAFQRAWEAFLPKLTQANFDEWRQQQAWTAEKYARWDRGDRTAPPWPLPGFRFRSAEADEAARNAEPDQGSETIR